MRFSQKIEPGVLPTFRIFIGVQLVISLLGFVVIHAVAFYGQPSGLFSLSLFSSLEAGLIFLYLSLRPLQRSLQSYYLPVGIVLATAGSLMEPFFVFHATNNDLPATFEFVLWQQIIFLLIPLIIISWQYSMKQVVIFCILISASNITLLTTSNIALVQPPLSGSPFSIVIIEMVVFLLVGHMIENLVKVQREQRLMLAETNARLSQQAATLEQLTISRERNRMARELHDVTAHTLSGVAIELEGLRTMITHDPEQANILLNHSLQAIRHGLTETRRALQELRAKPLEDLGLSLALKSLAESFSNRSGFKVELNIADPSGDLPLAVEQCIYRIAQEALTNINDHAEARNVEVILKCSPALIELSIRDDGCGFDLNSVGKNNKYGLKGMYERAETVGGKLSVESQIGKGTEITFIYGSIS
jgi:signal transduction histidine kinase